MQKKILEVESLYKEYGKKENKTKALNGLSCSVLEGEFLGIMGSSGSGKTTLLNCIATMISPTDGNIFLNGEDISRFRGKKLAEYRGNQIGYLFQEFELLDNLTGRENIGDSWNAGRRGSAIFRTACRIFGDYVRIG